MVTTPVVTAATPAPAARFRRGWAAATLLGGLVVTACDAVLLERSKGFFTGGFLAIDYLQGSAQTALFLLISVVVDAGLIGLIAALVAWLCARRHLHFRAAILAGAIAGTGALVISDVLEYEILRYLGDSFDLGLMFDLTGRSASEILAVSSTHLLGPLALAGTAVALVVGLVWITHRLSKAVPNTSITARMLWVPIAFAFVALATLVGATTGSDTLENGLLRKPAGRVFAYVANTVTDVDGDGYGIVGRLSDPDLFNGSVFPYAVDVPGNGIDEDGVGGDLPVSAASVVEPAPVPTHWNAHPDVVLFVLESFRADLVGAHLAGHAVTPVLDALAAHGVSVPHAFSHNGYTIQSRYSLFSGRLTLPPAGGTLVDDFKSNGYQVGYFSGQDESFGMPAYDIGFTRADVSYDARVDRKQRYTQSTTPGSLAVTNTLVRQRVREFLQSRMKPDAPLFLVVNFHDTHFPYTHAGIDSLITETRLARDRIAPEEKDAPWATYANTAANVDRAIGDVVDQVRRARGHEPGVIVTGDHGESLFEEGFLGHGYGLNDAQTHIPMVVANLPLHLPDPFGQDDLRSAIGTALSGSWSGPATPVLEPVPNREIFQYLGEPLRPRQIAFLKNGARTIYDFRKNRVQIADGPWQRPNALDASDKSEFLRLIYRWEAMKVTH